MVPYRRLYIWLSPHGSKRDGIRKRSAPPSIRCAIASSKPIFAATRSGYRAANASQRSSYRRSPTPSKTNDAPRRGKLLDEPSQQIESFLIDQPGDHPDERSPPGFLVAGQPEHFEHDPFGRRLPIKTGGVEGLGQIRIARRIPSIVIDPVPYPREVGGSVAKNTVEPNPVLASLNFAGIPGTHRGEETAEHNAALEKADPVSSTRGR